MFYDTARKPKLCVPWYGDMGKEKAVKGMDLSIKEGECVLVTGPSGCGKSTLLKLINGIIPEFVTGTVEGEILVDGQKINGLSIAERSLFVGSVFQNPKSQFFHLDTSDEVCFGAANHRVALEEIHRRYEETVALFDMDGLMHRNILALSGGEKQQVACASVAISQPSIYLLDEPSFNLDAEGIERLRNVIGRLKAKGSTILIAEHRLYYALEVCDRVIYMADGRIVFDQATEAFLNGYDQKKYGLRSCYAKSLESISGKHHEKAGESILVDEMLLAYRDKVAVHVKDLAIPKHKVVAIVGRNGAGKSSFIRGLTGIQKTTHCRLNGKKVKKKERIKASYMVMQDVNCQLYSESVLDELIELVEETDEAVEKAKEILTRLHLIDEIERHPMALSGG